MNHFIFGLNNIEIDLSGYTVAQAQQSLSDVLNLGPQHPAFIDEELVSKNTVVRPGTTVSFIKVRGVKGAGRRKHIEERLVEITDRLDQLESALFGLLDIAGNRVDASHNRRGKKSPYLNSEEAAEYIRTSMSSLYGVINRGHIDPLRGPKDSYRFTTRMLDDYLRRKKKDR